MLLEKITRETSSKRIFNHILTIKSHHEISNVKFSHLTWPGLYTYWSKQARSIDHILNCGLKVRFVVHQVILFIYLGKNDKLKMRAGVDTY